MMDKLKELWRKQWFKNAVFFGLLAIVFFTDLPKWVNVQFIKFSLNKPESIHTIAEPNASIYGYDLRVENAEGEQFSLADYRGEWVFINYWASWCVPCLAEFASLDALQDSLPDMKFFIINMEDRASFKAYLKKTPHNLPFYRQITPLPSELNPSSIPASLILNKEGQVVYKYIGAADWDSKHAINQLKEITR